MLGLSKFVLMKGERVTVTKRFQVIGKDLVVTLDQERVVFASGRDTDPEVRLPALASSYLEAGERGAVEMLLDLVEGITGRRKTPSINVRMKG